MPNEGRWGESNAPTIGVGRAWRTVAKAILNEGEAMAASDARERVPRVDVTLVGEDAEDSKGRGAGGLAAHALSQLHGRC